jgi:hypothetical protein
MKKSHKVQQMERGSGKRENCVNSVCKAVLLHFHTDWVLLLRHAGIVTPPTTHLCLCFLCSSGTIDFISPLNSDSICSETSYMYPVSYSSCLKVRIRKRGKGRGGEGKRKVVLLIKKSFV